MKDIFDECAEESIEEYFEGDVQEVKEGAVINEEMVEVIFSTIKSSFKVNVSGNLIYFRFEFISDRSLFTLRVRKDTFKKFFAWFSRINEIIVEGK